MKTHTDTYTKDVIVSGLCLRLTIEEDYYLEDGYPDNRTPAAGRVVEVSVVEIVDEQRAYLDLADLAGDPR